MASKKQFYAAVIGTLAVAICCFTPILIIVLTAVGLGAFSRYLDYVLWPALVILSLLTFAAFRRWKNQSQVLRHPRDRANRSDKGER